MKRTSKRNKEEIKGITRSPSFRDQFIELQQLMDSEEERIRKGVVVVTEKGKRTIVEQIAKWVYIGATTAFGSVAISTQLTTQDIVWIFAFLIAVGLVGISKMFENNRNEVRKRWAVRIELLFHTYRYRFRTFVLRQNKKYRDEDDEAG